MPRWSGILLAAGSGSRMGTPKASIVVDGTPLLERAVSVLQAGGCDEVIAVVRPGFALDRPDVVLVENPQPERGMGSSLRLGLSAASGIRAVVLLVDTPGITADAVRAVLESPGSVAIGTYDGQRGHPVSFDRPLWTEVAAMAEGDAGARNFLRARPELVIEVPCVGNPVDLDTPADLDEWNRRR